MSTVFRALISLSFRFHDAQLGAFRLGACGLLIWCAAGCTAGQDFVECSLSSDCESGLVCSPERYCVLQSDLLTHYSITAEPCEYADGPATDPQALLVGAILNLDGALPGNHLSFGRAILLALRQINGEGGAKVGPRGRPLAVLFCDDKGDPARTRQAVRHLNGLGVPAVIGPVGDAPLQALFSEADGWSPSDIDDTVYLPLSLGSPQLAQGLGDRVWPFGPDDSNWSRAAGRIAVDREAYGLNPNGPLVVLHPDDEVGVARRDAALSVMPAQTAVLVSYPRAGSFSSAASALEKLDPGVIVALGDAEVAEIIPFMARLANFAGLKQSVSWVCGPAVRGMHLFTVFDAPDNAALPAADILGRVQGVAPAWQGDHYETFSKAMIDGGFEAPVLGAAQAYDATLGLALALGAATAQRDLPSYRASDVVAGLRRLSAGESVAATADGYLRGRTVLTSPTASIDLEGASGPINFDIEGRPGAGPVWRWVPSPQDRKFTLYPL